MPPRTAGTGWPAPSRAVVPLVQLLWLLQLWRRAVPGLPVPLRGARPALALFPQISPRLRLLYFLQDGWLASRRHPLYSLLNAFTANAHSHTWVRAALLRMPGKAHPLAFSPGLSAFATKPIEFCVRLCIPARSYVRLLVYQRCRRAGGSLGLLLPPSPLLAGVSGGASSAWSPAAACTGRIGPVRAAGARLTWLHFGLSAETTTWPAGPWLPVT